MRKNILLLLSLVIAVLAGRMLLTSQHFYVHDDMQVYRVNEYINCFRDGQFPCRWSANLGKGYGYPLFNYYPPIIYAVPAVIHTFGFSLVTSLNLFAFLTFLLAAVGMYLLGTAVTGQKILGFLASAFYVLAPFHAVNVFIRGAVGENFVWSLAPLILYLIWQAVKHKRASRFLPLSFALVFLTHILSSFLVTGISIVWTIVAIIYFQSPWKKLWVTITSLLLGLGISAFFYFPALLEKNAVQSSSLINGYYAFTNHYVSLGQLFKEYKWNYGASLWSAAPDEMPYMVGHILTILLAMLIVYVGYLIIFHRSFVSKHKKNLTLAAVLLGLGAFLLLLSHFKSDLLWQLITPLQYYQFPWRFIAWALLPLTLALSLLFTYLPKKFIMLTALMAITALTLYSYPFFFPREYDQLTDSDFITGREKAEQQVKSLYDYLPATVKQVPGEYASGPLVTQDEGVKVVNYSRKSNYLTLDVKVEKPTVITLSQFYFPGWEGIVNGKSVELIPDEVNGLTQLYLREGESRVELIWKENFNRRVFDYLSLISLGLYFVYLLSYNKSHE